MRYLTLVFSFLAVFAMQGVAEAESPALKALAAEGNPCAMKTMEKHNPCNPCSMKKMANPCNMKAMKKHNPCNPCSMKKMANPCNMKAMKKHNPCNPCSMKKMANPCNPCNMKKANPCSMAANPCSSGNVDIRHSKFKNYQEAVDMGRKMWHDDTLGTSGVACLSCHADYQLLNLEKRQNFPHYVKMTGDVVTLDQMINYCMTNPMKGKPFAWNSKEMTAMAAYYRSYRMKYLREHRK